MSERIETYLAELDRRLAIRVPEKRRSELIAELRSHLHLRAKDAGEDEAQTLEALGPLALVAEDLIRSESGVDVRSPWRLAALPLGLLVLHWAIPWVLMAFAHRWYDVQVTLEVVVLVAFAWAVWRSKRWLALPIAAMLLLVNAYGFVSTDWQAPFWSAGEQLTMARRVLTGDIEAARANGSDVGYLAPSVGEQRIALNLPFTFGNSVNIATWPMLAPVPSRHEAQQRWESDGAAYLAATEGVNWGQRATLVHLAFLGWQIGVFALLNALILRLDARRRRLIHRKSRLA